MSQPTNLTEFYDALARHDWFFSFSDDQRVFLAGCDNAARLLSAARAIPGGMDLFAAYQTAVWTQKPLPARPVPVAEAA